MHKANSTAIYRSAQKCPVQKFISQCKKESITLKSFNTLNKETTTKGGPKWEKEWEKLWRKNDIQRTEKTKQSETTRKYFVSAFHNASDKEKQFPKLFFYCWCFHSSVSLMCHGTVCSQYENTHSHSRALSLLIWMLIIRFLSIPFEQLFALPFLLLQNVQRSHISVFVVLHHFFVCARFCVRLFSLLHFNFSRLYYLIFKQ